MADHCEFAGIDAPQTAQKGEACKRVLELFGLEQADLQGVGGRGAVEAALSAEQFTGRRAGV